MEFKVYRECQAWRAQCGESMSASVTGLGSALRGSICLGNLFFAHTDNVEARADIGR